MRRRPIKVKYYFQTGTIVEPIWNGWNLLTSVFVLIIEQIEAASTRLRTPRMPLILLGKLDSLFDYQNGLRSKTRAGCDFTINN